MQRRPLCMFWKDCIVGTQVFLGTILPRISRDKHSYNPVPEDSTLLPLYYFFFIILQGIGYFWCSQRPHQRRIQRVEYESLPVVCFDCGRYRHSREIYSFRSDKEKVQYAEEEVSASPKCVEEGRYGPWMLLERKHRKRIRSIPKKSARDTMAGESKGSRFVLLCENLGDDVGGFA
ncbi:hypothetical protein PVK06_009777 [Gossypium arboreum]|uniref:Uncharacterized protein n=1 Tax=Gossypium arboreum TaxID=29729 RepID=A0ABR0QPN6_GOSAR|nr:hypothetical protein PVK06_009777 [Gossypium arboreum]